MSRYRTPLLIFALALAVRLLWIAQISGTPLTRILLIDSETYDRLARLILAGKFHGEEVYAMNILYPYVLAAIYAVAGGPAAVFAVQAVLDALSVVMIHRLARRAFGPRAGVVAGVGAALYAPLVFYTGTLLTPTLIVFLGLAALTALDRWRDDPAPLLAAAAGLATGLATLARGNNALFALLALPWFRMHAGSRGRAWGHGALFLLAAAAPPLAATVRNTLVEGQVVPVAANYAAFYIGHNPDATGLYAMPSFTESASFEGEVWGTKEAVAKEVGHDVTLAESSRWLLDKGVDFALHHPAMEMKLLASKFYFFWNATESPTNLNIAFAKDFAPLLRWLVPGFGWIVPFGLFGIVLAWHERRRHLLLLAFLTVPLVTCLLFFVSAEYRITAAPILVIFAAAAIDRTLAAFRAPWNRRTLVTALVVLPVAFAFVNVRTARLRAQTLLRVDYLNFGTLCKLRGDYDDAAQYLRRSLAIDPNYGPALAGLADVENRRGNTQEAVRLAAEARRAGQAIGGDPADGPAQVAAARMYQMRDYAAAMAAWTALRDRTTDPAQRTSLDNNIGLCLYKLGRLAEAESLYRAVIATDTTYAKAWTNLGLVVESSGRPDEAQTLFQKALTLDPDNRTARRHLAGAQRNTPPGR